LLKIFTHIFKKGYLSIVFSIFFIRFYYQKFSSCIKLNWKTVLVINLLPFSCKSTLVNLLYETEMSNVNISLLSAGTSLVKDAQGHWGTLLTALWTCSSALLAGHGGFPSSIVLWHIGANVVWWTAAFLSTFLGLISEALLVRHLL
jgi:hypothetical protein